MDSMQLFVGELVVPGLAGGGRRGERTSRERVDDGERREAKREEGTR